METEEVLKVLWKHAKILSSDNFIKGQRKEEPYSGSKGLIQSAKKVDSSSY